MLQRFSVVGLALLSLLVGWMLMEVRSLRQTAFAIVEQTAAAKEPFENEAPLPKRNDLRGVVVDRRGKPLADAKVLVLLKTWPNGRYRQEDFTAKSDGKGEFRLPQLVPAEGQFAVHVTLVKERYALTSAYPLRKNGGKPEQMNFKLEPAPPITFVISDANGRPAAKARVRPVMRRSPKGEEHLVYFQGSESIEAATDDQGRIALSCFQRGDRAELQVELPGEKSQRVAVVIPAEPGAVSVQMAAGR